MTAHLQGVHPVLMAKDVAASVQFYSALGFGLAFVDRPVDPKYAGVVRDGVELHIQWADPGRWAYPTDRPAYRFVVSDVDAIYREFAGNGGIDPGTSGGSPWAAPADTPWGTREFHLRDPGQNCLQFYQPL
jgi:catechol 2,3-dioxygenase-like lactoylglutathione lyase family enzyme